MADSDSIDDTEGLRERALHLAAEVAETDDNNVPVLLLRLKDILDSCGPSTALGRIVRNDLWDYDVVHVCNLALRQDFTAIDGHWDTASKLAAILCQCCVELELPKVTEYKETFLRDVVENVLTLAAKLQDLHCRSKKGNQDKKLFQCFRTTIQSLEWLFTFHGYLTVIALECKRFIQILMSEDVDISLLFLNAVGNILKRNRNTLSELPVTVMHGVLDELVYKISASEETSIGRATTHLILVATNIHPPVVQSLLSKRYRGLKAYLSKWKGRGFDNDVKRLVGLLEAGTVAQAEQLQALACHNFWRKLHKLFFQFLFQVNCNCLHRATLRGLKAYLSKWKGRGFDNDVKRLVGLLEAGTVAQAEQLKIERAATVIQSFYRSHQVRKQLHRANRAFAVLQRRFRERRKEKEREKAREKEDEERKDALERRMIHNFRSSMRKQMKMLESLPAREVNQFMVENQVNAATRIQAGYRGMLARREAHKLRIVTQQHRAATVIQRQYRRYIKEKGRDKRIYPIPAGLTDARRVELQNVIVQRREKLPARYRSFEELKELHEKARSMLTRHVMMCGTARKSEQRRDALLARLKIDSDQLMAAPKLLEASSEVIDAFTAHSAPVIVRAQLSHNEELRKRKLPWWKKLWDETENLDPLSPRMSRDSDEELNF